MSLNLPVNDVPLISACLLGNTYEAKSLIEQKVDVNAHDSERRTALHIASHFGHLECVQLLLNNNARPSPKDSRWFTPLHRACSMGHDEIVKLLIENCAEVNLKLRQSIILEVLIPILLY